MNQITDALGYDSPAYPVFTPEMKKTHKILAPQMVPIHFHMIVEMLKQEGYDGEILENDGPQVLHEGLQYVHNDACYPCLVVIGQFIDALKSGKYDPDHTALLLTQTGGGCRASNYLHLLRKALVRAGFPQVPVISINASNLEKDSGLRITPRMLLKALAALYYGDALMCLYNQVKPYEDNEGDAERLVKKWQDKAVADFAKNKGVNKRTMQETFDGMAYDFAHMPMTKKPTYKVGVVGEIYVKFSRIGNSDLEKRLMVQGCEVNVPGLMGFIQYCIVNAAEDIRRYGGSRLVKRVLDWVMDFTITRETMMRTAIGKYENLRAPGKITEAIRLAQNYVDLGLKMGEGWLLPGEMAELMEHGFTNIVCAQPFGCLPNHVVGRGMMGKLRDNYPNANITSIDYDPSATDVNQDNRIKLMLSNAEKTLV
ncbi:2-hydroxyacyl-CoA dehydratase [Eubacteriales bacterium OttesenSCG-928-M02]|nr:2-hydroxyacyl-CoA dehydratase [Eubacteriales bacterium OttesenSCG-928-M02]